MKKETLRVLVAEDDAAMRETITEVLVGRGHHVTTCVSGHMLLDRLASVLVGRGQRPDVVVTDDRMPGARGSDVLLGLRQGRWPIPAVLVTAFPDVEVERLARAAGARLVAKPFDAEQLVEAVEAAGQRPG